MQIGSEEPIENLLGQIQAQNFPSQELLDAFKLLFSIIDKILEYPEEPKYKRLMKGNRTLQEKLFCFKGNSAFLGLIGFIEKQEAFVFELNDCTACGMERAKMVLRNKIRNFEVYVRRIDEDNGLKGINGEKKEFEDYKRSLLLDFDGNRKFVWERKGFNPGGFLKSQKGLDDSEKENEMKNY